MAAKRSGARAAPAPVRAPVPLPPWLTDPAERLLRLEAAGRLPHAILLTGTAGAGKRAFAHWLAERVLCLTPIVPAPGPASSACGACAGCRQLLADAHPDYRELAPEGQGIRIDAVRELMTWQQLSTPAGRHRVALLDGADTLNRNAANALLKTLEEPADGALLLLVADRPGALPATVRSRCHQVALACGDRPAALAWLGRRMDPAQAAGALERSGGAPFAALALVAPERRAQDALVDAAWQDLFLHRASIGKIADSLGDVPTRLTLAGFARHAASALRSRHGAAGAAAGGTEAAGATPHGDAARDIARRLDDGQWFTLRDRIERLHRIDGPSFRAQAVLEGLLADIRLMLTAEGDRQ